MKETQKTITVYEAFDGKEFSTEQECLDYEQKERARLKVISSARNIIEYCKENGDMTILSSVNLNVCKNRECPFFDNKVAGDCILNYPYTWQKAEALE